MTGDALMLKKYGRNFPKGSVLFREGELSKEMYVVRSGMVRITKKVKDTEKVLAGLGPGEFFGEMATLLDKPRSATAEVVEDSLLLVLDPKTFGSIMSGNVDIALKIMKKLAGRLFEANEQIEGLMIKDNMSKIVHVLMRLAENAGVKDVNCVRVGVTPGELAHETGLDAHIVKGLMERLSQANIITLEEKAVSINGIHKLKFLDFMEIGKGTGKI
jgi:CRP/FNR family transcriptional regulator, cyclic AMP receptor protein